MQITSHLRPGLCNSSSSIFGSVADAGFHSFLYLDSRCPLNTSEFAKSLQRNVAGLLASVKVFAAKHHSLSRIFDSCFTPIKPAVVVPSSKGSLVKSGNGVASSNRFSLLLLRNYISEEDICERSSDAGVDWLVPNFSRHCIPSNDKSLVSVHFVLTGRFRANTSGR
jgi:hypothetical protein